MNAAEDTPRSLLVVDDDERFRMTLARAFQRRGWDVRQAASEPEALQLARTDTPEYAVVDLVLKDGDGLSVVRQLVALDAATRVVLLTGFASVSTAIEAIRCGATHCLSKPTDVCRMIAAFDHGREAAEPPTPVPPLDRVEWEQLQRVLLSCSGDVTQAAKLLGLHRRSLQRQLRQCR